MSEFGVFSGRPRGFTLVEMMVAVAIAGALIAVALPQYCKYQSISKQAQAKVVLSSIWTAEQSFSLQTGSYTACIGQIGVSQASVTPTQYYGFGFNGTETGGLNCGPAGNKTCLTTDWSVPIPVHCAANQTVFSPTSNVNPVNTQIPGSSQMVPLHNTAWPFQAIHNNQFYAMAVGNISTCNSAYDRWSIDNGKTVTNDTPAL